MSSPLVSVLIPVFNGKRYLAECLDSVLAQDLQDFEILIADDGSTDGSPALIEDYARREPRIRWWRNTGNLGIGGNFNACLREARGEFVKYVLQDDKLLRPEALRRMVEVIRTDDAVTLTVTASHLIDAQSRLVEVRKPFRRSGVRDGRGVIVRCLEANANVIGEPSLALFRRNMSSRGFDEGLKQLLDLEMWYHLLEQGSFGYVAEPLCAFRQHPAQLSAANQRTSALDDENLALLERYLREPWMKQAITRQAVFTSLYYLRKRSGLRAAAMREDIAGRFGARSYPLYWIKHKVTRPFRNLSRWLARRGLRL